MNFVDYSYITFCAENVSKTPNYMLLKGMRSGVFYISKRYNNANSKYLKSYDQKQESKHTINLDANYLYGYAMSKFLPTSQIKWIDLKDNRD